MKEKLLGMTNMSINVRLQALLRSSFESLIYRLTNKWWMSLETSGKTPRKPTAYGLASAGEKVLEKPSSGTARGNASGRKLGEGKCTRCGYNGSRRCPAMGKMRRVCKGVTLEGCAAVRRSTHRFSLLISNLPAMILYMLLVLRS